MCYKVSNLEHFVALLFHIIIIEIKSSIALQLPPNDCLPLLHLPFLLLLLLLPLLLLFLLLLLVWHAAAHFGAAHHLATLQRRLRHVNYATYELCSIDLPT